MFDDEFDKDYTEMEDTLGDAMDMFGDDNFDEDEVLSTSRFGRTEMEDTIGDMLDEVDDDDNRWTF